MKNKYCKIFDKPKPIAEIGSWKDISKPFDLILGASLFGDLFLMDSKNQQLSLLYVMPPELIKMDFYGQKSFIEDCLTNEIIREDVLCEAKVDQLINKVGHLDDDEIFIPEPCPFLGGDMSIDSYSKGKLTTFLSIVGDLQIKNN